MTLWGDILHPKCQARIICLSRRKHSNFGWNNGWPLEFIQTLSMLCSWHLRWHWMLMNSNVFLFPDLHSYWHCPKDRRELQLQAHRGHVVSPVGAEHHRRTKNHHSEPHGTCSNWSNVYVSQQPMLRKKPLTRNPKKCTHRIQIY